MPHEPEAAARHDREIAETVSAWQRKPALREIYRGFYERMGAEIRPAVPGPVVELGSGGGQIKAFLPQVVTTDFTPRPGVDRVESAYRIGFAAGAVSHLLLLDVWHHLRWPGAALDEFARVLAPGGRVILFEPAAGLLGRLAYGLFHHEPLALGAPITWHPPPGHRAADDTGYYAAQGNAWRMFFRRTAPLPAGAPWRVVKVQPLAALGWIATGGYRGPQVLPGAVIRGLPPVERALARLPRLTATRLLVVLERT